MKFPNQAELISSSIKREKLKVIDVAKHLGVFPQFVCNINRGAAGVPPKMVMLIAGILNIEPTEIIEAHVKDELMRYLTEAGLD